MSRDDLLSQVGHRGAPCATQTALLRSDRVEAQRRWAQLSRHDSSQSDAPQHTHQTKNAEPQHRGQRVDRVHTRVEARRRSRRKVVIAIVGAVLVLGGAGGAWALTHRSSATAAAAATQLVAASTTTVKETVSATGTIEPATQASLKFAQGGSVTAVAVKVGDTVTAGQTLATIDPSTLQAAVTLTQQQLTAAQAQLTAATAAANSGQIASANAQVTSAQSKVTAAQTALTQASLTSTIAGTVAAVNVAIGDTVGGGTSSSSSAGSGGGASGSTGSNAAASATSSSQFTVISTNAWLVDATVGASDLAKLKTGLQATITPTDATQAIFGTVSTVGVIGTTTGGTSTFPVTIAVTGTPTGVYAGTTAAVVVTVKQVPDVLTVPTAAIHQENGMTVVYQMKDGAQVSTAVTVGTVYGATTQITKGIAAGDQVVVTARAGRTGTGTGGTGGTGTRNGYGNGAGTGTGFGGGFGTGAGGQAPGGGAAPARPAGN